MFETNQQNERNYLWTEKVLAVILGGGRGSRLYNLTKERSKPAISFGGEPRIIDVKTTRLIEADIRHILVSVEYKPVSLLKHIARLAAKEFSDGDFIYCIPNQKSSIEGIAESLYGHQYERHPRQLGFVPSEVLVLTGDHATDIDMKSFLRFHRDHNADVTLAVKPVPFSRAQHNLGAVLFDENSRLYKFVEKSPNPPVAVIGGKEVCYASLMDSIWKPDVLETVLAQYRSGCGNSFDLSKNVLTPMILEGKLDVCAYVHDGYWADVGLLDELIREVLLLTKQDVGLDLGKIKTYSDKATTGPILSCGKFTDSKLSAGDEIYAQEVSNVVFGYNVKAAEGSTIRHSVISDDSVLGKNMLVEDSYFDKNVVGGDNSASTPDSLDVYLTQEGNIVGPNRHDYKCTPLGGSSTTPPDHILLQKSFCGKSVDELIGRPGECEGNEVFIPELTVESNPCLEMVVTPERKVVVSRYSRIPADFRI